MNIEYRLQSAEPQKTDWHFEILQSAIDILLFKKQQRYSFLCQLQDGLFERPKIKPPALPSLLPTGEPAGKPEIPNALKARDSIARGGAKAEPWVSERAV